jgi:hypothetical protein
MSSIGPEIPTKTPAQVIEEICAKLTEKPRRKAPAYTLIVGAGFSYGVVPLTKELLHERIGDFYFVDQGQPSMEQKRELSALYWKEFNAAGSSCNEPLVELNNEGLPKDPTAAYQLLFTYRVANALFSQGQNEAAERSYIARLKRQRPAVRGGPGPHLLGGEKFVKGFLRHFFDPGGYEPEGEQANRTRDYCTAGRNNLNGAHFFLASLLELQQTGQLWKLRPFCRTIFTTNFDTLLQDAFQLVNVLYTLTDRPERGLDPSNLSEDELVVHLVYTHGSILRHNPASTCDELMALSEKNAEVLKGYLESRDVLVLGYGGWKDSLMSALARCDRQKHEIYWCNVYSEEDAKRDLADSVLSLLKESGGRAVYVSLGSKGADGFMARLFQALAPAAGVPALLRDPIQGFRERIGRVQLGKVVLTHHEDRPTVPDALPPPRLEASAAWIHGSTCSVLDEARRVMRARFSAPEMAEPGVPKPSTEQTFAGAEAHARALLEEGFALALAGSRDLAVQMWSRVLDSSDAPPFESAMAANYLGVIHAQDGNNDLAIPAYTRAIDLDHRGAPWLRAEVLINRGVAHHQSGQMEAALEDFSRAVKTWQDHPPAVPRALVARALVYRGVTHQMKGNTNLAQDDFSSALALKDVPADCTALLACRAVPGVPKSTGQF